MLNKQQHVEIEILKTTTNSIQLASAAHPKVVYNNISSL